jgi:IS1 family transposase
MERKERTKTKENIYLITMIGSNPRQIVGYDIAKDKSAERIQRIVDDGPKAQKYCTDGYIAYCDVSYYGEHIRNIHDKKHTHNVESINSDIRHYIPLFRRRSKCFPRSLETLKAVLYVFVEAYNKFGIAKARFHELYGKKEPPFSLLSFI